MKPSALDDLIGHIEYVVDLVGAYHEATPGAYPVALRARHGEEYAEVYGPLLRHFRTVWEN